MAHLRMWRQVYIYLWVILAYFLVIADDTVETRQLTLCNQQSTKPRSLVFVSTLDGKISALNAANEGEKLWALDSNYGPMLSSNIHSRELNNNGQWVRLIPSLSGKLYKFDGENLETVPVTTDQLLRSSFRYSDDVVFSGGKEIYSYGIQASTGKVVYECGINGCKNYTDGQKYPEQEIIVIKRLQQTVRAVEARTGIERWNFSVGQHNLVLIPPTSNYCSNESVKLDIDIKVVIPEGLIWAVNKSNPAVKIWQHKFDSPIVSIWHENVFETDQKSLEEINLFNSTQWIWGSEYSTFSPSLYIGMHKRQLYVQENMNFKSSDSSSMQIKSTIYPWRPYPALGTAIANTLSENDHEVSVDTNVAERTTALSVLYNSEYINGNGFYLYSESELQLTKQCNDTNLDVFIIDTEKPNLIYPEEKNDTFGQMILTFFSNRWKEMLILSVTILLNLILTHRLLSTKTIVKDAIFPPLIVERHVEVQRIERVKMIERKDSITLDIDENTNNFKSRYLTDFEPVDCLGRGGYGIVFEAKNKIDDCNYAIKRIALPNSQDSRDRVMREVKALAKLDHQNIVRYFNAWLECPPIGWQQEHDQQWLNKQTFPSSDFPPEVTETETETKPNSSVCIDVPQTESSSIDSAYDALKLNNKETDSDLHIVFESSSKSQVDSNAVSISYNTDSSNIDSLNINESSVSRNVDTNYSEDIVFEETDNNVTREKEKSKHLKSLSSSKLNNKSSNRKSTKVFLYIQMQLCQRLSLSKWLEEQSSPRDPFRVLNIFQQIIDAVDYVHLQGLIHRDLKPSNIFFAFDGKIKVGDFGLVTAMTEGCDGTHTPAAENENLTFEDVHTAHVGTHLYMSPEQTEGHNYNYKVDIYSLGIIFFELLTPFNTKMERVTELMNLKKSIFPNDFAENYPAEYDLLKMMLDEDPAKRPTAIGIKARPPLLQNEAFSGINANEDSKYHFELPQLSRHSSVPSSNASLDSNNT